MDAERAPAHETGWTRMARRSRFAAWMMAGLLVSSTALAQSSDELASDDAVANGEEGAFEFSDEGADEASAAPVAGDMNAGYVAPDRSGEASSPEIERGVAAARAGDSLGASQAFYEAMLNADPGTPLAQRAQFELTRALADMGLLYGARIILDEIIDEGAAHPYFQDASSTMITVARRLPGDGEVLDRVSAFAELFPDKIEPKYRDEYAYLLGEHFYGIGELDTAVDYLRVVSPDSDLYARSLFLSAITHVRRYDADNAAEDLKALLRLVEGSRGAQRQRLLPYGELARITMARMYYSTGEYDKAINYYSDIGQKNAYWLDALFESSWAYFQTDEFNRALGNLHSLNSPFFNDQYYPEAPILQAVIFFYNCQFDQVRLALDEFQFVYAPLRDELQITIDGFLTDQEAYEFLRDARSRSGDNRKFDARLQQIVDAALGDTVLSSSLAFVGQLEKEVKFIDDAPEAWSKSELGDFLYTETVGQLALSRDGAGSLVRSRLSTVLSELQQKERESSAILVETDLAEANALSDNVAKELAASTATGAEESTKVHSEQMVWRFDGEYWRDELGYYSYHIASQCRAADVD